VQWNVRVYDLLTGTREWKIDRIYGFVFPVVRRKAPTHDSCCGHTGSLACGHIEHTSHHSIWHASNVFATCAGAYRGKEEGGWERGAIVNIQCVIYALHVHWCAVIDEYTPARNITPRLAQSQIMLLSRHHKSRDESSTIHIHIHITRTET